jgi:hypothetical protein
MKSVTILSWAVLLAIDTWCRPAMNQIPGILLAGDCKVFITDSHSACLIKDSKRVLNVSRQHRRVWEQEGDVLDSLTVRVSSKDHPDQGAHEKASDPDAHVSTVGIPFEVRL